MLVIIGAWVVIRRGSTKTSRSHVPSMRPLDFKVGGGGVFPIMGYTGGST